MPRPEFQQTKSDLAPPAWESAPWMPEERIVEERRDEEQAPLRLSDEHLIQEALGSDSIRAVR